MNLHRVAEERSLAYHRAVGARLLADPSLVDRARARVEAWLARGEPHPEYAREWRRILSLSLVEVVATITDPSEPARALRQVTPFAGFLPPRERWAIWREVRATSHAAGS
ncbi:MAG TPA: hypothetical protein VIF15_09415 [Polyangiaceae bacterium]|jgi:hypothetical protein